MNRRDIEAFGEIQNRLRVFCENVLATLAENYPEVGMSDLAKVIGIDIIAPYLQLTYSSYPCGRSLFIPLQYVETEDVEGFCKTLAEKVKKEGKMLEQDEFIEKAYHNQWMKFYELFDIRMTDSESDLDRARDKLHGLIETMTTLLLLAKRQRETDNRGDYFTEKELPQLNGAFVKFIEWAKADPYWAKREKSDRQRLADIKAELLEEQKEVIKLIQECEYRAKEELQLAKNVFENLKGLC